ncbi:PREDICTED: CUB domain-containing protein 1 [Cyprinodon variegatus]|uniref:CUB domain-containing protein 1 n=1 Tax=Cyprinodon variegatus TaxID=28743 RepID=A0A3Q2DJJ4_CYPVA|nr:PREDICTED: CUB domain-containing protein 1 [Cyprinodon variegatus]
MRLYGTCAFVALLFLSSLDSSEAFETTVQPQNASQVTVSSERPNCTVCTVTGVNDTQTTCHPSLDLVPGEKVKLRFTCSEPIEQSYSVTITSLIECTEKLCEPQIVEVQSSILSEFSRTFIWKLKAPEKTLVRLQVLGEELTETSKPCTDGLLFSMVASETNEAPTQYCRGGSIAQLDFSNQGLMVLEAKPQIKVPSALFQASSGPLEREMTVTIGPSSTVVLSREPGEKECEVCVVNGTSPGCSATEVTLKSAEKLSLKFKCLKPQEVFQMKMTTELACTMNSCTPAVAEVDPDFFKGFKKNITWDIINVPDKTVITLEFPKGLEEKSSPSETCKDGFQYTVSTMRLNGQLKTSIYCKGLSGSKLDYFGMKTVSVEVPKGGELEPHVFSLKAAPRGGKSMSVTSDPKTKVIISRKDKKPDCEICATIKSVQECNELKVTLDSPHSTPVEFTCSEPQSIFSVEINREIDCTEESCLGDTVHAQKSFFPDFNRTFTWDLKVNSTRAFDLDFSETGLRQIPNEEMCPDDNTYSIVIYSRSGLTNIGTFCKGGPVTSILGRYKGRVSLTVPGNAMLDPVNFKLKVGPETKMLATVKIDLPRGVSDINIVTPNYPGDFPDNEPIQWMFSVPDMHNYTISFGNAGAPAECLNGDVEVEYQKEEKNMTKSLMDPQPKQQQGSFNMILKNCETNRTLSGLSLSYSVSVMRSGHPVFCTVDLSTHKGVSMQIEKVGSDTFCEMTIDSVPKEKINVAAGTKAKLSFLDCPREDVRLTASKIIACDEITSCPSFNLSVPPLGSCPPMPLLSFTWHLKIPKEATLDLRSPTGSLRQSLPGQECNQSNSLHIVEEENFSLGEFCSDGVIKKLQVHTNVSITTTGQDLKKNVEPLLNVVVSPEIAEDIIYRVEPSMLETTILATPSWPQGMKPFSTVSWIVDLPSHYKAHLRFTNVSKIKCAERHTCIKVQYLGHKEELMSRREDEDVEDQVLKKSFYLNISNCKPEKMHFGVRTIIALQKKTNWLAIILGLCGALVVLIAVLATICVLIRKKKAKMNTESSIYMGKGNIFRPGDKHFIKTQADNDSHVYDYIDDTMVYGHLLSGSTYNDSLDLPKGPQTDSYQTFTGPTDGPPPVSKEPEPEKEQYQTFLDPSETFVPPRPRTPIDRQNSLGFQDRRMVDNELYTFKGKAEMNTIHLSGPEMEPDLPMPEDSL